jgi:hypothetical protein
MFKRLITILGLGSTLAGTAAAFSMVAQPVTASAFYCDYYARSYTASVWYYSPGYVDACQYWWESPVNGSPGPSEVIFASTTYTNYWSTWLSYAGESHAYWWGYSPWCANGIDLNDQFKAGGFAISVSVPLGGSLSGGGDTIDFNTNNAGCNAYWDQVQHNYSGIDFTAFDIWTASQTDCGTFYFAWQAVRRCVGAWDWVNA